MIKTLQANKYTQTCSLIAINYALSIHSHKLIFNIVNVKYNVESKDYLIHFSNCVLFLLFNHWICNIMIIWNTIVLREIWQKSFGVRWYTALGPIAIESIAVSSLVCVCVCRSSYVLWMHIRTRIYILYYVLQQMKWMSDSDINLVLFQVYS